MSDYFREFPVVDYRFGDETNTTRFQHLGTYVDVVDQVKEYSVYYNTHNILSGERPEHVSYKLYGTTNYYWTFYLLNDHLRQNGWPVRDADLFNKVQKYYPNTVITTSGVSLEMKPKIENGGIVYCPSEEQQPLSKSKYFKAGNYVYFPRSKVAGQIKKVDQRMGMIYTDATGIRGIDTMMEIISEDDATSVIADSSFIPSIRYEEMEIIKVYDEWDAPHHYEDASKNWVYPTYSGIYPHPIDQTSVNTVQSVSNYDRLIDLNDNQKIISVIKADTIDTIASEFVRLLRDN